MIPLMKLREDMRFARELKEMIDVLKSATASQFRSLQNRRRGFELFKAKLDEFLPQIGTEDVSHPFLADSPGLPKLILIITSDEGFLGGLNSNVISAGLEQIDSSDEVVVMGERGARFLSENQHQQFTVLPGIGEDITYKRAVTVRDMIVAKFMKRKIGKVLIAYPRFVSLTQQSIEVLRILPCNNIFKQTGESKNIKIQVVKPLVEPNKDQLVDQMFKSWLMQKLYDIFWESKLSECAARIVHLEGSHEEILSTNKKLTYEYFKHLHEKSDKNIREIFASRIGWKNAENH